MEHLHTDRLEAARFQKLPTTINRQYNTSEVIIPKIKRTVSVPSEKAIFER